VRSEFEKFNWNSRCNFFLLFQSRSSFEIGYSGAAVAIGIYLGDEHMHEVGR